MPPESEGSSTLEGFVEEEEEEEWDKEVEEEDEKFGDYGRKSDRNLVLKPARAMCWCRRRLVCKG